jgi:hypothetical protein
VSWSVEQILTVGPRQEGPVANEGLALEKSEVRGVMNSATMIQPTC